MKDGVTGKAYKLINVSYRVQIEYIQYSALNAQLCLLLILNLDLIERRQLSVDLVETKS